MPDLEQSLQGLDLGHLKIIAQHWGIEFTAPDARVGVPRLVAMIGDAELLTKVVAELPAEARQALDELINHNGRMPWALFTRRYGPLREMGAARRDRDRPFSNKQASASEALWYRGLIGRAFFDTAEGPEEFAYVPDDFLFVLPREADTSAAYPLPGRPATQAEKDYVILADDKIIDDACTYMAGIRIGMASASIQPHLISGSESRYPINTTVLEKLLITNELLDQNGQLLLEPVRQFLEKDRSESLLLLFRGWLSSPLFNDLLLIPGMKAEGAWRNDPLSARQTIMDFLSRVPGGIPGANEKPTFWSLNSFVNAIRENQPDFQRSSGDYDAWYLVDTRSGGYLRGIENWDRVDGELIRFIITGPLHWLGLLDLGFTSAPGASEPLQASAFRFTVLAQALLNLKPPKGLSKDADNLQLSSGGRIEASRFLPRPARYQLARFAEWEGCKRDHYLYQLTPHSLARASKQGLTIQHLLSLFSRYSKHVPPSLTRALENWEQRGREARFESALWY
ncbi:MAG: helicase-associated domain-containing protein [Anaerolineales bacterium]|nr:helicase-associated domain-containing protein [Anaerolineales bacterium]